ncbi:hypothetical protein ES288_A11G278600v1, partial [Gossypium darwinii]
KTLCWNCCGIGNPAIVRELKQLLVANNPDIIFLCATKVKSNDFSRIYTLCRMEGCLTREGMKVTIQNYSKYHIDSLVCLDDGMRLRFTGFYGQAYPNNRNHSWDMLRRVKGMVNEGWIVAGDFNAILNNAKKEGGRRKAHSSMEDFCKLLEELALVDVKTKNGWFTWTNNREGPDLVKERLDRFLISENIIGNMPFLTTKIVRQSKSDHEAIIMDTLGCKPGDNNTDPRTWFRYDACWSKEKEAHDIVTSICDLKKTISDIMNGSNCENTIGMLKSARSKLGYFYEVEERYWAICTRTQWLREGDRNTHYFQVQALGHQKKNNIDKLKDVHGMWHDEKSEICDIAWNYFNDLFKSN